MDWVSLRVTRGKSVVLHCVAVQVVPMPMPMPMPMLEAHRAFLHDMRMLARDEEGREVFIGLTHEETEWYLRRLDDRGDDRLTGEERLQTGDDWLELDRKHEAARREMLRANCSRHPSGARARPGAIGCGSS